MRLFRQLLIERLEMVTNVARRHGETRPGFAMAIGRNAGTSWPEVAWLLQMQAYLTTGGAALDRLLDARPQLSPWLQLDLSYRVEPGTADPWAPAGGLLLVPYPFVTRVSVDTGDAAFFATCDGTRTFAQIIAQLQAEGKLPADLAPRSFMTPLASLVGRGVLKTDLLPFPRQGA